MEVMKPIVAGLYVAIFFIALFIALKFEWGKEGKDERGRKILSTSYSIVFPLLPLGWFLIELFHDYVAPISYDAYKMCIWFLVTGLFILHAGNVLYLRRKM